MTLEQNWVEALNINPDSLAEWSANVPAGTPLLVYCLEQGHISLQEYFAWAKEAFGLPVLDARYFQQDFASAFVEKARASGNWQPWCFPVEEWDGVTIVACVVPPSETEKNVRYVLSDPNALRQAWGPDAMPPVPSEEKSEDHFEMPPGFSMSPKPYVLNLENTTLNFNPEATHAAPAPSPVPKADAEREESSVHIGEPSLVLDVSEPSINLAGEKIAPQAKPKAESPELKVVAKAAPPVATKPTPPPPAVPVPEISTPKPAVSAKAPGKSSTKPLNETEATKELFAALSERYHGVAIMKISDQMAKLYKHDAKLAPKSEDATTLNLSYPTFLRIVLKTGQPYHGYLVDSPAHREFFQAIGLSDLPKCVTALPLKVGERMWGMILAIGEEENQKMEMLAYMQEHCDKYIAVMSSTWFKAA